MKKVLLVDDNDNFRRSLALGLEDAGYEVMEASGGMEALRIVQNKEDGGETIQGVIVDAKMPGFDGFWLCDQLSVMDPRMQVIILSAHSFPNKIDRYTLLNKPIDLNKLIEVMEHKTA